VNVEVLRDNLFRLGETLHASLLVGDFLNGAEVGFVRVTCAACPSASTCSCGASGSGTTRWRATRSAPESLGATRHDARDRMHRLVLTGVRYEHDEGTAATL